MSVSIARPSSGLQLTQRRVASSWEQLRATTGHRQLRYVFSPNSWACTMSCAALPTPVCGVGMVAGAWT